MKYFLVSLMTLGILLPSQLLAQSINSPSLAQSPPAPSGLVSCFDYYHFNSVQAIVQPSLSQVAQGSTLHFRGSLVNNNSYPVPATKVWGKLFHVRSAEKNINGSDVIEWLPLVQGTDLASGERRPISFEVKIPANAEPGTYQLATYVTNLERFELSGLTFTDDIVGSSASFQVLGKDAGAVRFDKDSVTVNGQPFHFASFPPDIPVGAPTVPVTANVANTSDTPFTGSITWRLYYWDAITTARDGGTLLKESTEDIKVHPHATTTLSYRADDMSHTVYYLVGEIKDASGVRSIIGLRYVRQDVSAPRFNFVTGSPAANGNGDVAVACFHSTNMNTVSNGRVELTARRTGPLFDFLTSFGIGQLAHATYQGQISPEIYALVAPLSKETSSFAVTAKLYQDGKLVDQLDVPYCARGTCDDSRLIMAITAAALILALLIAILSVRLHRRRRLNHPAPTV